MKEMNTKYLNELVRLAKEEMPFLQADLQNASTLYALQSTCQRLFNVTAYLLHHTILQALEPNGQPVAQPAPAPAPVVIAKPAPTTNGLGLPPVITQPTFAASQLPGMPDVPIQAGVTNVVVTSQGTRVISPSGTTTTLPPGEAVDLAASTGTPLPPPAPPGVENIVIPQGGDLPPDVLAALANRSSQ